MKTCRAQIEGMGNLIEGLKPLEGEIIPSYERVREVVKNNLILSNPNYPREEAVSSVSYLIHGWLRDYGMKRAADMVAALLVGEYLPTALIVKEKGNESGTSGTDTSRDPIAHAGFVLCGEDQRREDSEKGKGGVDGGAAKGGTVVALPPRGGVREGLSRKELVLELEEHKKDLRAFMRAYDVIHLRVVEVKDEARLLKLVEWSGTSAVMGALELSIHSIERVIEELKELIAKIDAGAILNTDE